MMVPFLGFGGAWPYCPHLNPPVASGFFSPQVRHQGHFITFYRQPDPFATALPGVHHCTYTSETQLPVSRLGEYSYIERATSPQSGDLESGATPGPQLPLPGDSESA